MKQRTLPWLLFLGFLSLLLLSSTRFVRIADALLWPIRFGILAGFSALLIWSKIRRRDVDNAGTKPDSAEQFLSSASRWYYRDKKR